MQLQERIKIAFVVITVCFIALVFRLGYIQLNQGYELSRMAMAQGLNQVNLEEYNRGEVLDRYNWPLTGSYKTNRIVIFPAAVDNPDAVVEELAYILNVPEKNILDYFNGPPTYLPYDLTLEQVELIKKISEPGIGIMPVLQRYGKRPLAAHLTGHLGKIPSKNYLLTLNNMGEKKYNYGDWIGIMGLEKHYDYYLKGSFTTSRAYMLTDARGRLVSTNIQQVDYGIADYGRRNVVTTIDGRIQQLVEEILDRHVECGAIVVMKPSSGDVLAIASRPAFNPDPEKINQDSDVDGVFINHATSYYQPGSLFKLVLAAAALEEGLVKPETTFNCKGHLDEPVRCWYVHGHGNITLHDAMINSCNPAFVQLGEMLGAEMIIKYAQKLGLNNHNIWGLPKVDNKQHEIKKIGKPYNLANSSIGQGPVMVTPVQLTAMMNTIASEGCYYQPTIIKEISSSGKGQKVLFPSPAGQKNISGETIFYLKQMLQGVTMYGVGDEAYVEVHGSAGKTGSAQVADVTGEYINAWFSGYVPQKEPRYTITILVHKGESGGETAAPLFRQISEELLKLD